MDKKIKKFDKFEMMCIINDKLENNQGVYSDEFIRENNVTKCTYRTRTLEGRCQYCRNFIYIGKDTLNHSYMENTLNHSYMENTRQIVCGDCYRFSKLWRYNLNCFFGLQYLHGIPELRRWN